MQLLFAVWVVLLFLFAYEGLEAKKEQNRLKKLLKQKSLNEEKLPENAKEKLFMTQKPRAKQKGSYALLRKTNKLKSKIKKEIGKHTFTNNNLTSKIPSPFLNQSSLAKQDFVNARIPKASLISFPEKVSVDSDEIVSEENASSQSKLKDAVLLQTLMANETDLDSNQPITDDSEDENGDDSVPGHAREDVNHMSSKERPDDTEDKEQVHKNEHEAEENPIHDYGDEVDDENKNKEPEDDNNDDDDDDNNEKKKNPGTRIENQEHLKKMRHNGNNNITPYEISDQMSHDLMRIYGGIEDQTAAMMDQERHLEALNKLRMYSSQLKQQMLQRLRFSYGNTIGQNVALVPQYYMPQASYIPEVPVRASLLLSDARPVYRPAYVEQPQRIANPLTQSGGKGYSINVDGLHGVFSKSPGYVVRFHSPDSEVTVVKKQHVVDPRTARRAWQVETG